MRHLEQFHSGGVSSGLPTTRHDITSTVFRCYSGKFSKMKPLVGHIKSYLWVCGLLWTCLEGSVGFRQKPLHDYERYTTSLSCGINIGSKNFYTRQCIHFLEGIIDYHVTHRIHKITSHASSC